MVRSKNDLRKELLRKLIHLLELPLLLGYTLVRLFAGNQIAMMFVTAVLLILLRVEHYRLHTKLQIPEVINIIRNRERDHVTGSIFFLSATIICFAAFDYHIAMLALLMTVFGDFASAIVGMKWGVNRIYKKKTLEGFTAGLLTNLLVGYVLIPDQIALFAIMALVASVIELITGKLDDNLTVPLAAGFVGQMMVFFAGIVSTTFPGPSVTWVMSMFM